MVNIKLYKMSSELGSQQQSKMKVAEEQSKLSSAKMNIVVFMTLLIDLLGFTVILPLMPKLLEYYGNEGSVSLNNFFVARSHFLAILQNHYVHFYLLM